MSNLLLGYYVAYVSSNSIYVQIYGTEKWATYYLATMSPMSHLTPSMYRSMELRSEATYLWAAMSHLTPSALDVILNPSGGMRILNNRISRLFIKIHLGMLIILAFLRSFFFISIDDYQSLTNETWTNTK